MGKGTVRAPGRRPQAGGAARPAAVPEVGEGRRWTEHAASVGPATARAAAAPPTPAAGTMETTGDADRLTSIVRRVEGVADEVDPVTLGAILDAVGRRSFGVALLVPGLVTLAPLVGDVPGVPTLMAVVVLLSAGQLLVGRDRPWLPRWLLERRVEAATVRKAARRMLPGVRVMDRVLNPRLTVLTGRPAQYVIAAVCVVVAAAMPAMELVPFSANVAGVLLTGFGLSLVTSDGLLVLITLAVAGAIAAVVAFGVL